MDRAQNSFHRSPPLASTAICLAVLYFYVADTYQDGCAYRGDGPLYAWIAVIVLAGLGEAYFARRRGGGTARTVCWGVGAALVTAFIALVIGFLIAGSAGCFS